MGATEKAYPEMMNMANRKTIRWKFIKSLEPPKVVHARHAEIITKENMFGRLIHGSETVAKDVLEYVVFEKHLSNIYGTWRLHSKIIPDWMPKREPGRLTYRVPREAKSESDEVKQEVVKSDEVDGAVGEKEDEEQKESIFDRFGRMLGRK